MILAALKPASPEPDPLADLHANVPPVDIPWPAWVWWTIGIGSVVVLGLLTWLAIWLHSRRPVTPPPTPRMIALRALEELRARVREFEPYAFSIQVSDVLRTYATRQFRLQATNQTSPEFLASIAESPIFTDDDRKLLAAFLERCDMLKFAHVEANDSENTGLLGEATAFVQGARP